MPEEAPKPVKSPEQLEADRIDKLLFDLNYFLESTGKVDPERLEALGNSWGDIVEKGTTRRIETKEVLIELNRIYEEMRDLALKSGISSEEITEERLDTYE